MFSKDFQQFNSLTMQHYQTSETSLFISLILWIFNVWVIFLEEHIKPKFTPNTYSNFVEFKPLFCAREHVISAFLWIGCVFFRIFSFYYSNKPLIYLAFSFTNNSLFLIQYWMITFINYCRQYIFKNETSTINVNISTKIEVLISNKSKNTDMSLFISKQKESKWILIEDQLEDDHCNMHYEEEYLVHNLLLRWLLEDDRSNMQ